MHISTVFITSLFWFLISCSDNDRAIPIDSVVPKPAATGTPITYKYLALTIATRSAKAFAKLVDFQRNLKQGCKIILRMHRLILGLLPKPGGRQPT